MKNINNRVGLIFFTTMTMLLGACTDSEPTATTEPKVEAPMAKALTASDELNFKKMALYPEGIEYDAERNRFLVTSIREGLVGSVDNDGTYTVLAQDSRMVSAVGIRVDAERDRVLVCNADPGASKFSSPKTTGKLAALAVFQLSTGKLIKYLDLAEGIDGGHFCNDIALDKDGTAYITDSFNTLIYKVTPDYISSVLVSDPRFGGEGFNLNGIVIKDNYLLVDKFNDGSLFKVPLDNPKAFTQVNIKKDVNDIYYGADGLILAPDGTLVVVVNDSTHRTARGLSKEGVNDRAIKLSSSDNWLSAEVVKKADLGEVAATTGIVRDGEIYVIYSMLHVLFNPKTEQHTERFGIHRQKL